jgi:hypothetical protein
MLDAVMRLAAGFETAPATATTAGRLEALAPWAPQLGRSNSAENGDSLLMTMDDE